MILAETGDELSRRQAHDWRTDGHTHRQTQATTIPEGQNWPRVKTSQSRNASSSITFVPCMVSLPSQCPLGAQGSWWNIQGVALTSQETGDQHYSPTLWKGSPHVTRTQLPFATQTIQTHLVGDPTEAGIVNVEEVTLSLLYKFSIKTIHITPQAVNSEWDFSIEV